MVRNKARRFGDFVTWYGDVASGVTDNGLRFEYKPDISRAVRIVGDSGKPICLSCGIELTYWGAFVRNMCSEHSR